MKKYNFVNFLQLYGYHFVFLMVNNINPAKYRRGKIGQVQSAVLCPYSRRSYGCDSNRMVPLTVMNLKRLKWTSIVTWMEVTKALGMINLLEASARQ